MIRRNAALSIASLLFFVIGCKSSTAPSSSLNGATGTLLFDANGQTVATTQLGSGTSTVLAKGSDPSYTPTGKLLYYLSGINNSDDHEQIFESDLSGTNATTLVNFGESAPEAHAHPKMSPDGRYISFNYFEAANSTLGPKKRIPAGRRTVSGLRLRAMAMAE